MTPTTALRLVTIALSLATAPVAGANESEITPVDSFRDANVIVSVVDSPDSDSDSQQTNSAESGPFEFDTDLSVALPTAVAEGRAGQLSDIAASGIQAEGTLATAINVDFGGAASTIAYNELRSTFTVASSTPYTLTGTLTASGEATCTFALFGEGVEHSFTVTNESVPLDLSGTLASGAYVLLAKLEGNLVLEGAEVGSAEASGSFAFELAPCPATPVRPVSWGEVKRVYR